MYNDLECQPKYMLIKTAIERKTSSLNTKQANLCEGVQNQFLTSQRSGNYFRKLHKMKVFTRD